MSKTIPLTQGRFAVVDDDMLDVLSCFKWFAHTTKRDLAYARRQLTVGLRKQITEMMHWYVIGKPAAGYVVDHINGNGLDNRRDNLRIVDTRENLANQKVHRAGKLAGCSYHKRTHKWIARTRINGKETHLGNYETELAAHNRYVAVKKELYASGNKSTAA